MAYTKCKFIPQDIAIYFCVSNFSRKRENEILHDLFENYNEVIVSDYRNNYLKFKQCVMNLLNLYEIDDNTFNEAELIMCEVNSSIYATAETDYFGAYFKLIRLQLMYSGISYRKIKLRTLLRDFGYKRRTDSLINSMKRSINALELVTCLRNYESCDIRDIKLDDMVIIRLKG